MDYSFEKPPYLISGTGERLGNNGRAAGSEESVTRRQQQSSSPPPQGQMGCKLYLQHWACSPENRMESQTVRLWPNRNKASLKIHDKYSFARETRLLGGTVCVFVDGLFTVVNGLDRAVLSTLLLEHTRQTPSLGLFSRSSLILDGSFPTDPLG